VAAHAPGCTYGATSTWQPTLINRSKSNGFSPVSTANSIREPPITTEGCAWIRMAALPGDIVLGGGACMAMHHMHMHMHMHMQTQMQMQMQMQMHTHIQIR
jgi:hypothetical protein